MDGPKGNLTKDQLEIMNVVWGAERPLTAAEIWQELHHHKDTARTTVLTLVKRLTQRGWLKQDGEARGATYSAACEQPEATTKLSKDFLDHFFGGSASRFVMNLLGSKSLSQAEAEKLRKVLDEYEESKR